MNIVLGLFKALKTKKGTYIDISMYENLIPLAWLALSYFYTKKKITLLIAHLNGGYHRYFIYETSDNRYLALGALEDKFWLRFCEIIKAPESIIMERGKTENLIKKFRKL